MKIKPIAGVLVIIVMVAGGFYLFSQIQEREAFKNVKINFESIEIKNIGLQYVTLNLNLKCYNPNRIPATLDGADYKIYLQGVYIGRGSINEKIKIPPDETKIVKSEINVTYKDLKRLLNIADEIIKKGEVNVKIKGNAYVEFLGRISFPFEVERKISLNEDIIEKIRSLEKFKIKI